ncbi:MAG: hypothetical protein ACLPID_00965 [Beijerinckiaceae bacterium]
MRSLVHDLRERMAARPRTLIAAQGKVWIWPGIALTSRHESEIVAASGETILFWITRLHGPDAYYTNAVHFIEEAARRLTRGDEAAAQRALDAVGLKSLSLDGAALMGRIAPHLGLEILDLLVQPGPRCWNARDIDLHVPFFAKHFDRAAPLAKFSTFDPLKHPRWPAGAPDRQGGEFADADESGTTIIPVATGGSDKGPKGGKQTQEGNPDKPSAAVNPETPGVRFAEPNEAPTEFPLPPRRPPDLSSPPLPPQRPSNLGSPPAPETPPPNLLGPEDLTPGIGHNKPPVDIPPDLPQDPPPEIPEETISDKARNLFTKAAVRWIARALILAIAPELVPYLIALQVGWWVARACWPYIKAYFQGPKTLEELQEDALHPEKGYDIHHFVEKGQADDDGVPESVWDGPENRVRVPTLKHWQITGWYMTKNPEYGYLSPRDYLKGKSWEEKMEVGRKALIKFGVLNP